MDAATVEQILPAVELLAQTGYSAWEQTRTTLDLYIENEHPALVLSQFKRHSEVGQCERTAPATLASGESASITFRSDASRLKVSGCMICRVSRSDAVHTSIYDLYLVMAWRVNVQSGNRAVLDLIETDRTDMLQWTADGLAEHYREHLQPMIKQDDATIGIAPRTWRIDSETAPFTIVAQFNDTRAGTLEVRLQEAKPDASHDTVPFRLQRIRSANDDILWDTAEGHHPEQPLPSGLDMAMSSDVAISVANDCCSVELCGGEVGIFEGRPPASPPRLIAPQQIGRVRLAARSHLFGATAGCIVFELTRVHSDHPGVPLLLGRRVFLIIDVTLSSRHRAARRACAVLVSTKDRTFPCARNVLVEAHRQVLTYQLRGHVSPATYRLDDQDIHITAAFEQNAHATLQVRIFDAAPSDKLAPLPWFISTPDFSVPGINVYRSIQSDIDRVTAWQGAVPVVVANSLEEAYGTDEDEMVVVRSVRDPATLVESCVHWGRGFGSHLIFSGQSRLYRHQDERPTRLVYEVGRNSSMSAQGTPSAWRCLLALQRRNDHWQSRALYVTTAAHDHSQPAMLLRNIDVHLAATLLEQREQALLSQLQEHPVQLPCGRDAVWLTHERAQPPHLVTVSLTAPLDLTMLYRDTNYIAPDKAVDKPLETISIRVENTLNCVQLTPLQLIGTGMPAAMPIDGTVTVASMQRKDQLGRQAMTWLWRLTGDGVLHSGSTMLVALHTWIDRHRTGLQQHAAAQLIPDTPTAVAFNPMDTTTGVLTALYESCDTLQPHLPSSNTIQLLPTVTVAVEHECTATDLSVHMRLIDTVM